VSEFVGKKRQAASKHLASSTIVVAAAGALFLSLRRLSVFFWAQGRSNDAIPGFLLDIGAEIVWLVCVAWLLVAVLLALAARRARTVVAAACLLLLSCLPWVSVWIVPNPDPTALFLNGFNAWVRANVAFSDAHLSLSELSIDRVPTSAPFWWPLTEPDEPLGVLVPADDWPGWIAELEPAEVRVLREQDHRGMLLEWEPSTWLGWTRFLYLTHWELGPPSRLVNHMVLWEQTYPGVWVGARLIH